MSQYTAIMYPLTDYEYLILGSKHPKIFSTDHKPIIFLFTQKCNPNHRVYRFQIVLRKFQNLHIVRTEEKNLALPDSPSRNIQTELLTRKTTVEIPQNIKFFIAKDELPPRLECKYAVKTYSDTAQINTLESFPLYIQIAKTITKIIAHSLRLKNNTQLKLYI